MSEIPSESTPTPIPTTPSKPKVAFITGISGQDGSYLTEYLSELGYIVHGIVRRHSVPETQTKRLDPIIKKYPTVKIHYGDITDQSCLIRLLKDIQPDEIYNLAAMSHVQISFEIPSYSIQVDALGALNMLEALRISAPRARYYQASSSEMFGNSVSQFGNDKTPIQTDTTPMRPVSPYGCAKLFAHNLTINYRHAYGLFACNGILFNHEGVRRSLNFITAKVVQGAVKIKLGLQDKLELGNLDSYRDWSDARDMCRGMHMILNHTEPDDFILASGETHSVRELCDYVFTKLGLNYKDYVVQNPKYFRPEELNYLRGCNSRAKKILGWEPKISFTMMLDEMIDHWMSICKKEIEQK